MTRSISFVKMLLHKLTLFQATITIFMMLEMTVVFCQGQDGFIRVYLENVTAPLGGEGEFYCETEGEGGQLWVGRFKYSEIDWKNKIPKDIVVEYSAPVPHVQDQPRTTSINVTIPAEVKYNNTLVRCSDHNSDTSRAYFTVQGGPTKPEVSHEVVDYGTSKLIHLSWPRPFTWEEYPITGYNIICRNDSGVLFEEVINDDNDTLSVDQELDIPICRQLQCNVTASNDLASSVFSSDISISKFVEEIPDIELKQLFTEARIPQVSACVKLPELCSFQVVNYTITISLDGEPVFELTKKFSYSTGNSTDCVNINEKVLEEGTQYSVHVFVDAGESGNSSLNIPFKPEIQPHPGAGGVSPSNDNEDFQTVIVAIVSVGTVLVALVLMLIIIVTIMQRRRKQPTTQTPHSMMKAPVKRTTTPMVNNPIYDGETHESPFYEQVSNSLGRLISTSSHSNLDSSSHRVPSPTHSATTPTTPSHPVPSTTSRAATPGSTTSNSAFSWPYSGIQTTDSATFDAIEADVNRLASCQSQTAQPSTSTPGEESYMTMHSAVNLKNVNGQNGLGKPRYAIDIHGNRYIEC